MLRETLAKGGAPYRPRIAHPTLAAAFVDPALAYLEKQGADVRLGTRLRGLTLRRSRRAGAGIPERPCRWRRTMRWCWPCRPGWPSELLPGLTVPDDFRAIVNAHFQMAAARRRARRSWA